MLKGKGLLIVPIDEKQVDSIKIQRLTSRSSPNMHHWHTRTFSIFIN